MQKVREFRRRAKECRELSKKAAPHLREHYQRMADVWDKLAQERLDFFVLHPEKDTDDEAKEDASSA